MRYFGINQGRHDGGVAAIDQQGELLVFSQTERLTRKKADCDVGDLAVLLNAFGLEPFDAADLIFNSWPNRYRIFYQQQEWPEAFLQNKTSSLPGFHAGQHVHFVNHHLCHIAASWMFREEDNPPESLYIAFDASGYRSPDGEGFYSVGIISPTRLEEHAHELDKFKYSPQQRLNQIKLPHTESTQIAGKLMGLAGYVPRETIYPIPHTQRAGALNASILSGGLTESAMIECASYYASYIEDVKRHLATVLAAYPHENVVVGGGVFLALELNSWLVEQGRRLIFAPPANDSGIALGSAALGYFLANGQWPKPLRTPYLQWQPAETRSRYITPAIAAKYLAQGEVLGVLIGKGEAGPRALGNRSLLAAPSKENARKVSIEIKGREFYRPVAPIVTERDFAHWFIGPQGRYMQFRNYCTPDAREVIPGVVHNDNTARAQVLRHEDNPWLYEVLVEVGKLTGAECLINTSLNGKGRPICNTLEDAAREFAGQGIRQVSF